MSRSSLALLLVFAALTAAGCASAEGGSTAASRRASIAATATPPLAVRGTSFEPREHVTVTVRATGWSRKQVVAGSHGAFTVRFQSLDPSACAGLSITAVGSRGSRAYYKRSPGLCPRP
jgi:hypothetical protein